VAALGLVVALPLAGLGEDEKTLSLAERAERARGKKGPAPKVLTNEDLRKARGTVIVLPEPEPSASPSASPTALPSASPVAVGVATNTNDKTNTVPASPGDAMAVREALQEAKERAGRYRKALQDAENELRVGGDRLEADRRAALTKFLIDGRRELTRAEQALVELQARLQGPAARQ
jgi:hypothetical protein